MRTHDLIHAYRLPQEAGVTVLPPRPPTLEELGLFHTEKYLEVVRSLSAGSHLYQPSRYGFGPGDNPVFRGMFESEGLKVGSAAMAAGLLIGGECDIVFSYSGGLHHGGPDFASGFCVFNDAAVAILTLLQAGKRVAYVDVDVHHGDGVQAAFYTSDKVLTISLHQDGRTLFPGTGFENEIGEADGVGTSVNLPLPPETDDETYLRVFDRTVPALVRRFEPDVLVTQLGVDTHAFDPLANLALTTRGHVRIFQAVKDMGINWLALGGGGYNLDVVPRSWTLALAVMAGYDLANDLPAAYRSKYGGETLHDPDEIVQKNRSSEAVRHAAAEMTARVRALHGLDAGPEGTRGSG